MEIKILGSVSPYCKGDKNCVGYLVKSNDSNILLDCGNGISRNMNMATDLNNLTIIISHLHKDHYAELLSLGYASYINHRLGFINKRIKVYIPKTDYYEVSEDYTNEDGWGSFRTVKKEIEDYHFLMNFGKEHYMEFLEYDEDSIINIDDIEITFSENPHQINTYSARLKENENIFVYSADTGFEDNSLIELSKEADILLCESTFLKGQIKNSDNHLYAYEAATIAKQSNVKQLVLTHFYPEIEKEKYLEEAKQIFPNTIVAEEGKILKIVGKKK
ncbi:MAG: MBL fold metallo-hydrolase [Lactobacillales bacterium]|nr:MBL fold metallo-hydrolase [Lactobacillales bacterium]